MEAAEQRLCQLEIRISCLEEIFRKNGTGNINSNVALVSSSRTSGIQVTPVLHSNFDQRWSGVVAGFYKDLDKIQQDVAILQESVSGLHTSADHIKSMNTSWRTGLNEVKEEIGALQSGILSKQCRIESSLSSELPEMRRTIADFRTEIVSKQDTFMKDAKWMHSGLVEDVLELKAKLPEMNTKIDSKVDISEWKGTKVESEAAVTTMREIVASMCNQVDLLRQRAETEFAAIHYDIRKLLVRANFDTTGVDS